MAQFAGSSAQTHLSHTRKFFIGNDCNGQSYDSLRDAFIHALDNNLPLRFTEQFKGLYNTIEEPVSQFTIAQYQKFIRRRK